MAKLHTFSALSDKYPDYLNYPKPESVKALIGGAVDADWIENTCAIRLSRTLNYNGFPVPGSFAGLHTVRGDDGKRYAFRVRELRPWLVHRFGQPDFDISKKQGEEFDKSRLAAIKGIIGFDIRFTDATGHLDLWDGSSFTHEYQTSAEYWTGATRISIWKASG
jgi:hypothetical protein